MLRSRARSHSRRTICSPSSGIERRDRLVGQDRGRVLHERARDRDALLLAAGELAGAAAQLFGDPDGLERRARFRVLRRIRCDQEAQRVQRAPPPERARHDVLRHGEAVDEVVLLRDERQPRAQPAQFAAARRSDVDAFDVECARRDRYGAVERTQQRRLAAAARPDERDALAGGDVQRHAVERGRRAASVDDAHAADLEHRDQSSFSFVAIVRSRSYSASFARTNAVPRRISRTAASPGARSARNAFENAARSAAVASLRATHT